MATNKNGVIVWEGMSMLDRRIPIAIILVGLETASTNTKTGGMVQSYIIRTDMNPVEAVYTRQDGGICGGCIHRMDENGVRTCYVNVGQGPNSVYRAYQAGSYARVTVAEAAELLAGKVLRAGTYGDPVAGPLAVWEGMMRHTVGHTGYTHQWRSSKFAGFAAFLQASCETAEDVATAHAMGWTGTFQVVPVGADLPATAEHCPASAEAGKLVQCSACLKCDGAGRDIVIHAHGATKKRYTGGRRLLVLA